MTGDKSTSGTDHCECSEKRRLCGNEACDEKHPEKRFICTRPPGHDGPHSACTPSEHPLEWWGQDDGLRADGGEVEDGTSHVPPKFQGTATKADEYGLFVLTVSGRCSCGARDWGIAPDWKVPAEGGGGYMTSSCPECLGTMEYSEQWERVDRLVSDYSELKPREVGTGIDGGQSDE